MVSKKEVKSKGDIFVAGDTPFTFAVLEKATSGKVLKRGTNTVSWGDPNVAKFADIGEVERFWNK